MSHKSACTRGLMKHHARGLSDCSLLSLVIGRSTPNRDESTRRRGKVLWTAGPHLTFLIRHLQLFPRRGFYCAPNELLYLLLLLNCFGRRESPKKNTHQQKVPVLAKRLWLESADGTGTLSRQGNGRHRRQRSGWYTCFMRSLIS
jgi:hypothetical protein